MGVDAGEEQVFYCLYFITVESAGIIIINKSNMKQFFIGVNITENFKMHSKRNRIIHIFCDDVFNGRFVQSGKN